MGQLSSIDAVGAILAGGQSLRMGRDKALLPLGRGSYATRIAETLRELSCEPILITNRPEAHRILGMPMVQDLHPGRGPLSGIEAAFERTPARAILFIPVDMPHFPSRGLRALWDLRKSGQNACYRLEGRLEPWPCLLTRHWWAGIREGLWVEGRSPGLKGRLEASAPRCLDGQAILDEEPLAFESANTPELAGLLEERLHARYSLPSDPRAR
ncbi:MAG: molybdenum cofactor guanylyltransferase [Spirochaetes bacterium]|nr:molybdenum cofactor guanylyltransferase [Spirochaetota bacterium]